MHQRPGHRTDYPQAAAESPSLREHLLSQVSLTNIGPRDRRLVELLIDALEEDGYLTMPLEEVAASRLHF